MKALINTCNDEQIIFLEKTMRYYIGTNTISLMSIGKYTNIFNQLAGMLYEKAALPYEKSSIDTDIQSFNYDHEREEFTATYF